MKKMKFRFDKTIVEINGTIINIEISSKEDMVMFSKKHLSNFKEKYKNFHFNVTGPKNLICTNKGDYNVINNKKDFIGTKLTTVAKLVSVNESLINGDYQYELFFNNYYNTTGFRAILKTRNKTKFRLLSAYRIKGNFINEKRDLKDYEKEMKYIPAFLNLHTIEELADEEVIYNRFYEYEAKRFPMTGYSKYSKGFLDEIQIKEMKLSKKISNLCITDTNTLNWVEKINENCPLGLEAYFYDDEEDIEVAQKFSVQIYINSKDSEITRLNKTIVVNEGIRAVNEMISNSTIHKGCYLFKLSDVIKYRTMDLIRLGSLNKNGFVFKTLLESRYGYLNMYANIFDYYGIEPFSNTSKVVYDGNMTFSRLKDINNKIHKLGKLKNKKVLFCDNGVVADAKDRKIIKYYLLSKKLTPIAKKNRRDVDLLKMEYTEHRIPYIHSFNEAWEELTQQGFADDEILEILINEKEVFISLPQKKEITVIPQSLITDTSLESRTEFKNECLKAFREKYCPETQKMLAKRLKLELGIIISKGYENLFMTAKAVAKRVSDKG